MALKVVILLFLALAVTKACNLDWILEDVYDDSDSDEDDSSEKPGNNQNPSTTPASSESVSTKPFPVIPATAGAAPGNNSAPSNSTSRAVKENPRGKRHRRTHHRRRLIRTIPTRTEFDDQTVPNEGRGFNSELDQFSLLGRFAPLIRKKLVQERTSLHNPIDEENDMEEARAFTSNDFGTTRRTFLIRSPESRRGNLDLEQNIEEEEQLEPKDFIKIFMEPLGRKNVEEADEFLIPEERMESLQLGESINEEQPESVYLDRDVGDLLRSVTADESLDDADMSDLEIPLGRRENLRLRQNIGRRKHSSQHSINSSRKRIIKLATPSTMRMSESDLRKYAKEYLRKLLLRDTEGKTFESKRYVYIPVPKKVLNKKRHHSHSSRPHKQKGSNVVSIINREYFYELPEIEHLKNEEQESYLTLLLPQTPPKKPERLPSTQHLMLNNQNPRRPILIDPYESYTEKLVEDLPQEIKNPSINHVNHIKEHILRETVKVNPIDNSEIRNVHEQTRLSIIKNPNVPIDITMEKHDLSDLDNSPNLKMPAEPQRDHMEPNNMLIQQLPLVSYDFHQNVYHQPQKVDQKVEPQHEHMMIQQLPSGGANINYLQGSANSAAVAMPNKYMEGHMVNQPGPSQLSNVYLQAHTYPINYPINNPAIAQQQSTQTVKSEPHIEPVQETNFYMQPQVHEMDHMHHNVHEALPHHSNPQHEADPHQTHHDQQYQQLPLLDMINNFQGHNIERPMSHQQDHEQRPPGESINHDPHHGPATATSTGKHAIKNAV